MISKREATIFALPVSLVLCGICEHFLLCVVYTSATDNMRSKKKEKIRKLNLKRKESCAKRKHGLKEEEKKRVEGETYGPGIAPL